MAKENLKDVPIEVLKARAKSLSQKSFWTFCRFMLPSIYKDGRWHLKELCDKLQDFVENKLINDSGKPWERLIINMPPRHGKTLTVELLCAWMLGKNKANTIATACYNEALSGRFGKSVRNFISEQQAHENKICYADIFPDTKIKQGDASYQLWSLEGQHFNFLATSPGATLTGFGCKCLIIDDLLKNAQESNTERILEEHWDWYNNTTKSRVEAGGKRIVIQTRWSTKDLTGKLLESEPDKWYPIIMPAMLEDGTMLCPEMFSSETYEDLEKTLDPVIFQGNYQQKPFDSIDRLYQNIRTYILEEMPQDGAIELVVDTADQGDDYLCAIIYRSFGTRCYVLDVLYTQDPMTVTEGKLSDLIIRYGVERAYIESNNGGHGFGRNVERLTRESGYTNCQFELFTQTGNKVSRIITNATSVQNSVLMPDTWKLNHFKFWKDVTTAGRNEKWLHDDALDALTLIVEKGLGAGLNPKVYPDFTELNKKMIDYWGSEIHLAQSLTGGAPHCVAFSVNNGMAYVVKTFSGENFKEVLSRAKIYFIGKKVYWYPDAEGVELTGATVKEVRDLGFETRIGIIYPSDLERVSVPNTLFRNNKLFINRDCVELINSIEIRRFDGSGKPEKMRSNRLVFEQVNAMAYGIWRIMGRGEIG